MGLGWNFICITPDQYNRLCPNPTLETVEAIHDGRSADGLGYVHSPGEDDPAASSFEAVYHLGIRTDYDELDILMTFDEDEGPVAPWPLGENGVKFSALGEVAYVLNPEEVRSVAPLLRHLLDVYLEQRFLNTIGELGEEGSDVEEIYPELRVCFRDLTALVETAARQGEAIFWQLS